MPTSVGIMVGVWNALILGGAAVALIRRKQLLDWITGGDHRHRTEVRSGDDAWDAFVAEHPELQ